MAKKDFSKVDSIKQNIGAEGAAPADIPALKGPPAHDVGVDYLDTAVLIDIDKIEADPQIRTEFNEEALEGLAESIRKIGIRSPVEVRWIAARNLYVLIAGERRYRAAKLAGLTKIPAIRIIEDQTEVEVLTAQITENIQREDLNPVDKAKAFRNYMAATGQNAHMAAKSLGVPVVTFSRAIGLLDTAPAVQDAVEAGELAPSSAHEIGKLNDPALQEKVAAEVVKKKLNREQTVAAVEEAKAEDKAPEPKAKGKRGATRGGKVAKGRKESAIRDWTPKLDTGVKVTFASRKAISREALVATLDQLRARMDEDFPIAETAEA